MARIWTILNKFTGGEISPNVWGRTETDQWPAMVEEMRNIVSDPRGGAKRRDGLHYVVPTKYPQGKSRLIPFVFSREQSYIMEFGDYYVRFFKDNGYVEDIGNVVSYLGDGSSVNFIYPYPDTLEADIKVYDENGDLVDPGDATLGYTVIAIDNNQNYALSFDDAAWNKDYNTTGSPWTIATTAATNVADSGSILANPDMQLPIGGQFLFTVDMTAFSYTNTTLTASNADDIPLISDGAYISVESIVIEEEDADGIDIDWQFEAEDTTGTRASTFFYEIRKNGEILSEGTRANVIAPQLVLGTGVATGHLYIDDVISLQVRAIGAHNQSEPQVSGSINVSQLSTTFVTNPDAKLKFDIIPKDDTRNYVEADPVVGTITVYDSDTNNYFSAPMRWEFVADDGLLCTLDNPLVNIKSQGYVIQFTNAPEVGTVRTILDDSLVPQTETVKTSKIGAFAPTEPDDIFEIQSPFSADELEDLYYAQANDVMLFCVDGQKPWRLTRFNPYDWRWEQPTFTGAPWEEVDYNPLDGYPRTVCWFQERLYFGGTVAQPQTLWGSRAADFYDFTIPVDPDPIVPDDPVEYTIAAYTHEAIEWLSSERVLIIGTSATEHRLAPDQYIATDRLPTVSRMSAYGGAHVMPAYMGNLTVFVQTAGNQVRTFEQSSNSVIEKWDSIELDWMAEHLTAPKVKQLGYALNPNSILYMVTLDGDFLTMTYEPGQGESGEMGWAKHDTDGDFYSCASIPETNYDQVWAIVDREIEGVNYKYVEYFDPEIYTDATLTYPPDDGTNYPPLQSVGGLGHLEGKMVTIKADGSTHPDLVVSNGQVELNDTYQNIEIGLKYIPKLKLQRFALAGEGSNLQGWKGRWIEVYLRLVDSAYPLVDGVRAAERQANTPMNEVEPIVTDDVRVYNLGFDKTKQLTITQDLPLPLHITAIFGIIEFHQG